MTAFPLPGERLRPPAQALSSDPIRTDYAGSVFRVPVGDYGRFSARIEGDMGSVVVEAKAVLGGGSAVSWDTAKTMNSTTPYVFQVDVAAISEIEFEITTVQAGGHIVIHTIAEAY